MSAATRPQTSAQAGVSIWLDGLTRSLVAGGGLRDLVEDENVAGVMTNPAILAAALGEPTAYTERFADLAARGATVDEAVRAISIEDARGACDVLRAVYERTQGSDGRVCVEVDPRLAGDTDRTVQAARTWWQDLDRPNAMVTVPATVAGLAAITRALAEGISVNVTLIFGLDRYRGVLNAYLTGLEQARQAGLDLSRIRSVASFFVSRLDTEIDQRLEAIGSPEALALAGRGAVASARLAYQVYEETFATPRWQHLAEVGGHRQRPLWVCSDAHNPRCPDTRYVEDLRLADTVIAMPAATLDVFTGHGHTAGDVATGAYAPAAAVLDALQRVGVSYADVVERLQRQGLHAVQASWQELRAGVAGELDKAAA